MSDTEVRSNCEQERYCSVPECDGFTASNVFHEFPSDGEMKRKWIEACNITKDVTNNTLVCSSHFNEHDYMTPSVPGPDPKRLREDVIPSKNLTHEDINFEEFIPDKEMQKDPFTPVLTKNSVDGESHRVVEVDIASDKPSDSIKEFALSAKKQKTAKFSNKSYNDKVIGYNYKHKCCVPQCEAKLNTKRSYHHIPKLKKLRQQWIIACHLKEPIKPSWTVCSAHFLKNDYLTSPESKRQVLKIDAVPSVNLPDKKKIKIVIAEAKSPGAENEVSFVNTKNEEDKEKVTTIIYVPSNCNQTITQKPIKAHIVKTQKRTDNSDLLQNASHVLENQPVKVVVVQNKTIGQKKSNINIKNQSYVEIPPKIKANKPNHKTVQKVLSTDILKQDTISEEISNKIIVKKQENVNISIERHGNKNIVLRKQDASNDIQVKTKTGNKYRRKNVTAITLCAGCGQYCNIVDKDFIHEQRNSETIIAEALLELQDVNPTNEEERTLLTRKEIEICDKVIRKQSINLMALLTNDNELLAFTGINFDLLDRLTKGVTNAEGIRCVARNVHSPKERIVICLCKLRTNIPFRCLAALFGITQQLCASYFFAMIRTLSTMLSHTIYWSKTEDLLKNVPKCFQSFKQTRVILSCTEAEIEKQRCSVCQVELISSNKQYESVKLVLGVAPNGLITFKSKVFDAQAPDPSIFTQTNILELLDPVKEAIMADKSLNIEAECVERNITLIKPPKLEKSKHFTMSDLQIIKNVCAARIHVERTLQRFKMYKILQTKISWRVVPYLDDVCTVIAGIVNMKNPIVPDEEHLKLSGLYP